MPVFSKQCNTIEDQNLFTQNTSKQLKIPHCLLLVPQKSEIQEIMHVSSELLNMSDLLND